MLDSPRGATVLRCFKNKPTSALHRRYETLEKWAARADAARSPVLADAVWVDDAVHIDGRWWPAVVMEHVAGESLRAHLASRLGHTEELNLLAGRWRSVLGRLDRDEVAHGDLQHDNIRIAHGGRMRLIDLDAVWMAELSAEPPQEFGHPHFQHPERLRSGRWDRAVDHFSGLVIHLSILALAVDPGLWEDFHNEDNLLFTATDFEHPMASPLWFRLAASRSVPVRRLTALLDGACRGSMSQVPPPHALDDPEQQPGRSRTLPVPSSAPRSPAAPIIPAPGQTPAVPTSPVVAEPSSAPAAASVSPSAPTVADRPLAPAPGAPPQVPAYASGAWLPSARRPRPVRKVLIGVAVALLLLLIALVLGGAL
ncbi:hypothetical protein ACFV16_25070 [Streptomyces massasporeus]|uniref:hypothetical protein n=1 Tax=Streptomyces massasporeus TaxID=67324 RepID=UPI0036D1AB4A